MKTATLSLPTVLADVRQRVNWLVVAVFGLIWLELISRLRFEWTINPQYGYGWTVPFLAAYLFWRRVESAPEPGLPSLKQAPAVILVLAAALLPPIRLVQEANPDWRLLSWAMALAAVAISLGGLYLAGGSRWLRHFAFPIFFFLVAVPWPTQFEQAIIQGLMRAVAGINVTILNVIDIPAVQLGNVIEIGSGFVGIDEACTGVRSLQATFMLSLFFGEFYGFPAIRRVVLIVAGVCFAFVCNLVRTFLLVWVAAKQGAEAIKSWHDPAGLTILTACLFGLWGLSLLLSGKEEPSQTAPALPARKPLRIPRIVLLLLLTFTIVAEGATQIWYRMHEAGAARPQAWTVEWPNTSPNWQTVPIADRAQELLRYNEGGGGAWRGEDGHNWNMFFFRWLPGRTAGLFIKNHRPDVCLPASGMTLRGAVKRKVLVINGVTLPVRSYVFDKGSDSLHVYYCYWDGLLPQQGPVDQEDWTASGRLDAVRRGKRDVGTQMLELAVWGYEDDEAAESSVRKELEKIVRQGSGS